MNRRGSFQSATRLLRHDAGRRGPLHQLLELRPVGPGQRGGAKRTCPGCAAATVCKQLRACGRPSSFSSDGNGHEESWRRRFAQRLSRPTRTPATAMRWEPSRRGDELRTVFPGLVGGHGASSGDRSPSGPVTTTWRARFGWPGRGRPATRGCGTRCFSPGRREPPTATIWTWSKAGSRASHRTPLANELLMDLGGSGCGPPASKFQRQRSSLAKASVRPSMVPPHRQQGSLTPVRTGPKAAPRRWPGPLR